MLQQEALQIPAKVTILELGVAVGLAIVLIDKIIAWIQKLKVGNGVNRANILTEEEFCKEMASVQKIHSDMSTTLQGQTLVLDRIFQSQTVHLSALEKIVERLDRKGK